MINATGHAILAMMAARANKKEFAVEEARQAIEAAHSAYEHHEAYKQCKADEAVEESESSPEN